MEIVTCLGMVLEENTHRLGEVSLYGWSPVLQVWIQLRHYKQIPNNMFSPLVKSSLMKLESSCTVIFPPMVSVLRIRQ